MNLGWLREQSTHLAPLLTPDSMFEITDFSSPGDFEERKFEIFSAPAFSGTSSGFYPKLTMSAIDGTSRISFISISGTTASFLSLGKFVNHLPSLFCKNFDCQMSDPKMEMKLGCNQPFCHRFHCVEEQET